MQSIADISRFSTSFADILSPATDRERVDHELRRFLDDSRRRFAGEGPALRLLDQACEFVTRGGKRLRPCLCLASYRIVTGRTGVEPPRSAYLVAAGMELFHAFMLAHDDLIDGSLTRRGAPVLHEAIRNDVPGDGLSARRAADLGLVAGDLLFALGMRLVAGSGLKNPAFGRVQRRVADMLVETGMGQAMDLLLDDAPLEDLSQQRILSMYLRKTSRYSVTGPLALGAIMAGANTATVRSLTKFGDRLGLGYQIRNDLDNLDGINGDYADLDGGKRTFILWSAWRLLSKSGRRELLTALDLPIGADRRARLLRLIRSSGAIEACRRRLNTLHDQAIESLRSSPLDEERFQGYLALSRMLPNRAANDNLHDLIEGDTSMAVLPVLSRQTEQVR